MASCLHSVNFDESGVHKPELLVSRTAIRERQRRALRLHIGRGRRFSVKEASEGSGVPERQIEAAMCLIEDENYRPLSLENVASLAKFLGASFVSQYLELSGLGAFELMDGQQPLPKVLASAAETLTRDDHIRKALDHLSAAEAMA
jgi:hypothetical protein